MTSAVPWGHSIVLSALVSAATAQMGKFGLDAVSRRKARLERLIGAGGMPSAHAAMVVALMTGVEAADGWRSTAFAMAAVLALIVMYDAMSLRRTVGRQSRYLNQVRRLNSPTLTDAAEFPEFVGHNLWEVLVGGAWGGMVALMLGAGRP
ncbi:MAG: divergent PAP2 family protein [Thermaerobacter sp.]|nr:divergent PAP2 family protein [Thermaerobacter sp.]